jgi:hypothetical protein
MKRIDYEKSESMIWSARLILLEGVRQTKPVYDDPHALMLCEAADETLKQLQDYLISQT